MNLVIDQGNTATKFTLFKGDIIVEKQVFTKTELAKAQRWIDENSEKLSAIIISSVTNDLLSTNGITTLMLDDKTPIPLINSYKTPKTLGKDRLANAVGAWSKNPSKNTLCIDLGTCIKYDLVTANGEYLGGNISPGLTMRYKALHHFTDKLPLLEPQEIDYSYGTTTETSLRNGVQQAIYHEINGFIHRYSEVHEQLTIFMTGGDVKYFDKVYKNSIFANPISVETELTALGLNEILTYNVKRTK